MLKLIFTKAIPSLGKMARNPAESPLGAALRQLLVGTVSRGDAAAALSDAPCAGFASLQIQALTIPHSA